MRITLFTSVFILGLIIPTYSQLKLPALIDDHMVVQRDGETKIWGWDNPGQKIKIKTGWSRKKFKTKANANGFWEVLIKTPSAGGPYEIEIKASETRVLTDVLSGDVWVCSGQSNMEWDAARGYNNAAEEVKNANFPQIRLMDVKNTASKEEKDDIVGEWAVCAPENIENFSAVGYFFGREIHRETGVPIGLIGSEWGGTPSEAWTEAEYLYSKKEFDANNKIYDAGNKGNGELHPHQPGVLFNGMIAPLLNYTIKGVIWYQGESNVGRATHYSAVFPGMIENWRDRWGYEFPFYFVQLAPYNYGVEYSGAMLREAQLKSLKTPNTGMAVIMDIGNPNDIHPRNKQDVGRRLAYWALANDYGKDIVFSGPLYKDHSTESNKIAISFDHTGGGLMVKGDEVTHLEIAGIDKIFKEAKSKIEGDKLIVFHPDIKNPLAVRYGFHNTDEPNLYNKEGLPASSFRTDNWKINTETVQYEPTYSKSWEKVAVELKTKSKGKIYYTTDGTTPGKDSNLYTKPFELTESSEVKTVFIDEENNPGPVASFHLNIHKLMGKPVMLMQSFDPKYTAGGNLGLVDGIKGSLNYNDGKWQGFEGKDFMAVINLQEPREINSIKIGFLRAINGWILLPSKVTVMGSENGTDFEEIKTWELKEASSNDKSEVVNLEYETQKTYQFLKVKAVNAGPLPEWHPGKGEKAWIFIDEIEVY